MLGGALVVLLLLPLVILNALITRLTRGLVPSLILGPLDRALFKPYEVRRFRHERIADETHGFWSRVGDGSPGTRRASRSARSLILLVFCSGLAFFSTDLTTNDSYRTKVESVEGQDILARSFPAGASAPTDIVVPDAGATCRRCGAPCSGVDGVELGQRAGGPGRARRARPGGARRRRPTRRMPST